MRGRDLCRGRVDFTWDAGADAGWRAGLAWGEGRGLGDARRHAARLGRWVALATQAGSTVDEDFPGIAALVDPAGEVVARLPDWRPGTLVVEIPVDPGQVRPRWWDW